MFYTITVGLVLLATLVLGTFITARLKQLKLEQTIREDGPQSHLKKAGTPSMGGLIFLIPILLASLFYLPMTSVPLIAMLGYAVIGGYDDLEKRVIKKSGGLSIPKKFFFQVLIGVLVGGAAVILLDNRVLGFTQGLSVELHPALYTLFIIFFILSVTNGMNFTDGLDGLATLVSLPVFALFAAIALLQGNIAIAAFCGLAAAALLGFLFFNRHPAKIFMGDTGSMALGALVAGISIVLKVELLFLVFGFVYLAESVSVVLQIAWFKGTKGKRLFKMAPLHHHFELSGWAETKVVAVFTLISCGTCLLAYLLYNLW